MKTVSRFFWAFLLIPAAGYVYNLYPENPLPKNVAVDSLVVDKSERTLMVYSKAKVIKK